MGVLKKKFWKICAQNFFFFENPSKNFEIDIFQKVFILNFTFWCQDHHISFGLRYVIQYDNATKHQDIKKTTCCLKMIKMLCMKALWLNVKTMVMGKNFHLGFLPISRSGDASSIAFLNGHGNALKQKPLFGNICMYSFRPAQTVNLWAVTQVK